MTYSLTIFKSQFDNKTHRRIDIQTWDQFKEFLFKLSQVPKKGKKDAELLSPAIYEAGTTRSNKSVLNWASWCAVDVDDFVFNGELKDELYSRFGHLEYVCYSTASSTLDQPKFRLVFPLEISIERDRIKHFWFALNSELEGLGDKQTKDLSRMYYIPADYANSNNFYFTNSGRHINVDELLAKWKYDDTRDRKSFLDRLPQELKDQVISHRMNKLENTSYSWTGYRDCPFWPKKLATEYIMISGTGWYTKMYAMMVNIAGNATYRGYPITATEIAQLCKEFDSEHGNWYENRPIETEADRALEYIYKNGVI